MGRAVGRGGPSDRGLAPQVEALKTAALELEEDSQALEGMLEAARHRLAAALEGFRSDSEPCGRKSCSSLASAVAAIVELVASTLNDVGA